AWARVWHGYVFFYEMKTKKSGEKSPTSNGSPSLVAPPARPGYNQHAPRRAVHAPASYKASLVAREDFGSRVRGPEGGGLARQPPLAQPSGTPQPAPLPRQLASQPFGVRLVGWLSTPTGPSPNSVTIGDFRTIAPLIGGAFVEEIRYCAASRAASR